MTVQDRNRRRPQASLTASSGGPARDLAAEWFSATYGDLYRRTTTPSRLTSEQRRRDEIRRLAGR